MNKKDASGIIIPSITPFTALGEINFNEAEKITKAQIGAGANGFYVGGSTGEGLLQSIDERKEFLSCIAEVATDKLLMAQVGAMSLSDAILLAEHAASCGYDYISSTPPFYYGYRPQDVIAYYTDLAEASPQPLILYNTPATTGRSLSIEQMKTLMSHKNIAGIKYTDTNMFPLERIISSHPNGLYYNGPDEMLIAGLSMGAMGGIGSTYNILTPLWVKLFKAFQTGDISQAQHLQNKANQYIETLLTVSPAVIPGIKASLEILGYEAGICRKPLPKLSSSEKKLLEDILSSIDDKL